MVISSNQENNPPPWLMFRFWCPSAKAYVADYCYRGPVDELFCEDPMLLPEQCTGLKSREGAWVYENDILLAPDESAWLVCRHPVVRSNFILESATATRRELSPSLLGQMSLLGSRWANSSGAKS